MVRDLTSCTPAIETEFGQYLLLSRQFRQRPELIRQITDCDFLPKVYVADCIHSLLLHVSIPGVRSISRAAVVEPRALEKYATNLGTFPKRHGVRFHYAFDWTHIAEIVAQGEEFFLTAFVKLL